MAVLGEAARTSWFALAGADVHAAEDPGQVRQEWSLIDPDTVVVVVTPMAAAALASVPGVADSMLVVTLPALLQPGIHNETVPVLGS
ncbi:MAG: hypothetical protein WAL04_13470 [Acidimicrobiales bacterium]